MRKLLFAAVFCACATIASAQVAELSASGGASGFRGAGLIPNALPGNDITLGDGVRLGFRLTINNWKFFGNEVGLGYAHSALEAQGQGSVGMAVYSGFYDLLAYATPEGAKIRPFLAGGVQFSSFFPPGTSTYYNNQQTKFGFNYGGGVKFRISGPWGARIDVRQYNCGKPDVLQTPEPPSGRLKQNEVTVGVTFNL